MKHLLIAILIAGVVGCGGNSGKDVLADSLLFSDGRGFDATVTNELTPVAKEDTVIIQEAWYDSGMYYLHTYVKTGVAQNTKFSNPHIGLTISSLTFGESTYSVPFAPYENLIKGKFKYVYEAKSTEKQKASDYISSLYAFDLGKARIEDSVKMIENAPTWVWDGGGTMSVDFIKERKQVSATTAPKLSPIINPDSSN